MADGSSPMADSSSGLSRAVHATASPRRSTVLAGYERSGARRERRRLLTAGLALCLGALVLALFFLWERQYATGVTYSHWGPLGGEAGNDYDEGAYVISAQLLLKGYPLFHSVFSAQPAFFLPSMAAVLRVAGDAVAGGHIYEALCGLAALIGVFWMGWMAYRPLAGALAAALLALSPGFLLYAHAVEAEMPMLGLCTLAVAAAQAYYVTQRRLMAALSGLLLMAGTEMKLLSVVVVAPLAGLLLGGAWLGYRAGRSRRDILLDALVFLVCLVVPALVVLAALSPSDQFRQVITFHLAAGHLGDTSANAHTLATFLTYDPGLLLVAGAGTVLGLLHARSRYVTILYALWFLFTLAFLWRYHPLFQHQLVVLLPPLALLGAALADPWYLRWVQRPALRESAHYASMSGTSTAPVNRTGLHIIAALAAVVAVAYLSVLGFSTLPIDSHLFTAGVRADRVALSALLDRITRPADFVVCDDPMVCLGAHRLMPPELDDPSMVRMGAHYLTAPEAESATLRYHAAAIVASRPSFVPDLPDYMAWVAQHYRQVPNPVPGALVYVRR